MHPGQKDRELQFVNFVICLSIVALPISFTAPAAEICDHRALGLNIIPLGMDQCKEVDLQENHISVIGNLTSDIMTVIQLGSNDIVNIEGDQLAYLPHLHKLNVSHNKIQGLNKNVFRHLRELQWLGLSKNDISSLAQGHFDNSALTDLLLNSNKVIYIEEATFDKLPSLQFIDLSDNDLQVEIPSKIFHLNDQLKIINFRQNSFNEVPFALKSLMSNPERIDLSHNPIWRIQNTTIRMLKLIQVREVDLQRSQLNCRDCDTRTILLSFNDSHSFKIIVSERPCEYPPELQKLHQNQMHRLLRCNEKANECHKEDCRYGTCEPSTILKVDCRCQPGFEGTACDLDVDECVDLPKVCFAENTERCNNLNGSYACVCKKGWMGPRCEIEDNKCRHNKCKNNGTCRVFDKTEECQCMNGFTGSRCETEIGDCDATSIEGNPCKNGGICFYYLNNMSIFCSFCDPGFGGPTCEEYRCRTHLGEMCNN